MKTVRRTTWLLPAGLIVLGLASLSGCFSVPGPNRVVEGQDLSGDVADRGGDTPVVVGETSRRQVLDRFGPPARREGDALVYAWTRRDGAEVNANPLCFGSDYKYRDYTMTLRFDGGGTLSGYDVSTGPRRS